MSARAGDVLGRSLRVAAFALTLGLLASDYALADTVIQLSWDANTEADLAGYRLRYGTTSGSYGTPIDVGDVLTYAIHGLDPTKTYYFVATAYDFSGNEGAYSNEASGQPKTVAGPAPTITKAWVLGPTSQANVLLQSGRHDVSVGGTNFQPGAALDLGSGITTGTVSVSGTTSLQVTVDVAATAALGPRSLTVTNPDGGTGSLTAAFTVTKTTDIDRDCKIDGGDLNAIARAWGSLTGDAAYIPAADLNGDGTVDGTDLDIFIIWFGSALAVCP